ncbi:P2Y purinoceptor 3 [Hypanus sabinus]|uniref:P2Y purinoceptor 3 n=1 Tax=Hypanus sabinus TaxID=79690 RepID=UPI0028C4E4CA|nr:P2Y purinoceptor 3 [Hypanus sabinus]
MENSTSVPANSGCTFQEKYKNILLPVTYTVVLVLGMMLNLTMVVHIWFSRKVLTKNTIYMLNLAIADILYVCSLPLLIYNYIHMDYWPFGEIACKAVRFLFYANLHGSILFLTCISLQRYIGICYPLSLWHKKRGPRFAWTVCGLVWVLVLAECAPTWRFATTGTQRNRTVCYDLSSPEFSRHYYPYGITLTVVGFAIPFIGLLACYCAMVVVLSRPDQLLGLANQQRRLRALRMVVIVATVFVISFVPFHLTKTMYLIVRAQRSVPCETLQSFARAYKSTRPLASMNSVLDPILFYFTHKNLQLGTRRLKQMVSATQKGDREGTP